MRIDSFEEIQFLLGEIIVKVLLKISKWDFISVLVLAIILSFLLYRIVSQMNHSVFKIFSCELFAWCSDVALFIPVTFDNSFDRRGKHVASDIKFSFIVQERHKILLNDGASIFTSRTFSPDHFSNLFYRVAYLYATSLIRVFPRFNNPQWVWSFVLFFLFYVFKWIFSFIFKNIFELVPRSIPMFLDMKSQGNVFEWIIFNQLVIRL